jgi:hypothetical protein
VPRIEWAMLVQAYSIDRESNSLSLFNVIEEITLPHDVPVPPEGQTIPIGPQMALIGLWSRSDASVGEKAEARIEISFPDGRSAGNAIFDVDLTGEARTRGILKLPFLPFSGEGFYTFSTALKTGDDWNKVHSIQLRVKRLQAVS